MKLLTSSYRLITIGTLNQSVVMQKHHQKYHGSSLMYLLGHF